MGKAELFTHFHDIFAAPIPLRACNIITLAVVAVIFSGGCGSGNGVAMQAPADKQPRELGIPTVPPLADLVDRTVWDACFIGGKKVGYSKTSVSHENRNGQTIVKIEALNRLSIQRFGQPTEMTILLTNRQNPEGRLLDFETQVATGETPLLAKGRVEGDRLVIDVSSKDMQRSHTIPWSAEFCGMFGVEQMLLADPMKPGQRRSINVLIPVINRVALTRLVARDYEPLQLPSGTYRLLRIDTTAELPDGQKLHGTIWTDRRGDALKTYSEAADQELIRTTEADALDKTGLGQVDLGEDMKIRLSRRLSADELAKKVNFRIHVKGGDPAALLVESASQRVRSLDAETALVTVYALRPGDANGNSPAPADRPGRSDLEANNIVQSDNPKIIAMAAEAAGDLHDEWQIALALEKNVHRHIAKKDFSTAFATAAEVAETRQGDCTEHAVLLAALARARGIPARGAVGLVYLPDDQAFFYHMWTEVFIGGRWIPLDAALGRGGVAADRLTLAHSNLKGASAFSSFLPVAQVMGRMSIEAVDDKP